MQQQPTSAQGPTHSTRPTRRAAGRQAADPHCHARNRLPLPTCLHHSFAPKPAAPHPPPPPHPPTHTTPHTPPPPHTHHAHTRSIHSIIRSINNETVRTGKHGCVPRTTPPCLHPIDELAHGHPEHVWLAQCVVCSGWGVGWGWGWGRRGAFWGKLQRSAGAAPQERGSLLPGLAVAAQARRAAGLPPLPAACPPANRCSSSIRLGFLSTQVVCACRKGGASHGWREAGSVSGARHASRTARPPPPLVARGCHRLRTRVCVQPVGALTWT